MATLTENWRAIQDGIEGWLEGNALEPMCRVDEFQQAAGIRGNLCEIGVHHGKLLVSLSHLARHGEVVVGVDVFEDQHLNENHGDCRGDREKVQENIGRFAAAAEFRLIKADSLELAKNADFIAAAPYRIFSVDGSHTERHALNDLYIAVSFLAPGGVVMLDDYGHVAWRGVKDAADRFFLVEYSLNSLPPLVPFLLAASKLFLCGPAYHAAYIAPWCERATIKSMYGYETAVC